MTENELRVAYLKLVLKDKYDVNLNGVSSFRFNNKDIAFSYYIFTKDFCMDGEVYEFNYGYTNLDETFEEIRKKNQKYQRAYEEVRPYVEAPLNEVKRFLIENVEETKF